MYQKFIKLSENSYIEITTRLYNKDNHIVLALRGTQDDSPAIASVIIDDKESVNALLEGLKEAMDHEE